MINALAAGDSEEPGSEGLPRIKLGDGLEGADEGVLGDFLSVNVAPAETADESEDASFVAINQIFEGAKRAGLGLTGQRLVGRRLRIGGHGLNESLG